MVEWTNVMLFFVMSWAVDLLSRQGNRRRVLYVTQAVCRKSAGL